MEKCDKCGKVDHILFTINQKNSDGTDLWVCDHCFAETYNISFDDFSVEDKNNLLGKVNVQ